MHGTPLSSGEYRRWPFVARFVASALARVPNMRKVTAESVQFTTSDWQMSEHEPEPEEEFYTYLLNLSRVRASVLSFLAGFTFTVISIFLNNETENFNIYTFQHQNNPCMHCGWL